MNEDVCCNVSYGMYVDKNTKCLKILKSLYGLKQSGFNFYTKLSRDLINMGFVQSRNDPTLRNIDKSKNAAEEMEA